MKVHSLIIYLKYEIFHFEYEVIEEKKMQRLA